MTFLESLGHTPPSALQKHFERVYPFPSIDTSARVAESIADQTAKIARTLHDDVTRVVNADSSLLANADQMASEFRDTARRGRRPVGEAVHG